MMRRIQALSVSLLASTAGANLAVAAQAEPSTAKDLTSVIALMGLPCGEVVQVTPQGNNDNLATCKDVHRYRVYVNADGRVVADPK